MRIAIVVLGLFLGLAARMAVECYHYFQARRATHVPAASVTPLPSPSERTD